MFPLRRACTALSFPLSSCQPGMACTLPLQSLSRSQGGRRYTCLRLCWRTCQAHKAHTAPPLPAQTFQGCKVSSGQSSCLQTCLHHMPCTAVRPWPRMYQAGTACTCLPHRWRRCQAHTGCTALLQHLSRTQESRAHTVLHCLLSMFQAHKRSSHWSPGLRTCLVGTSCRRLRLWHQRTSLPYRARSRWRLLSLCACPLDKVCIW